MSTGGIWLQKFGTIIRDYFGHVAYQVGSSLTTKDWRDVDVRLILPDDEQEMTGLPIDFQIQPQSWANEKYPGMRSALIETLRQREEEEADAPQA